MLIRVKTLEYTANKAKQKNNNKNINMFNETLLEFSVFSN